MGKFYNLHFISDLDDYEKGQGIPHHRNFGKLELGTIISYNESDTSDSEEDKHVPFGVSVKTIPADAADSNYQHTMKADGASAVNKTPSFLDPSSKMITKKVNVATGELVDLGNTQAPNPALSFVNPQMTPQRRI